LADTWQVTAVPGVEILALILGVGSACFGLGWLCARRVGRTQQHVDQQRLEVMKNNLIAAVSHELRTPLTSINGSLALLTAGVLEAQPERAERMLRIAASNADRLGRLVNDILDVERLSTGRAPIDRRTCSPAKLVAQATDAMREQANQQHMTLIVESTVDPALELCADSERLQQVLRHLLDNALKFSPASGPIRVRLEADAKDVRFSVVDRGQGIPSDKLELIFGRFQQLDTSDARRTGGTGLGLAICKGIVDAHGGLIVAESAGAGAGSTFSFVIPR
jgi:signal transduction histidine kinase